MRKITMSRFLLLMIFVFNIFSSNVFADNGEDQLSKAMKLFYSDLEQLGKLEFSKLSSAHINFFGESKSGRDLVIFITKRIKTIMWDESLPDDVGARTVNGNLVVGTAYLQDNQVGRWNILIHEARHSESSAFDHVECSFPYEFTFNSEIYIFDIMKEFSGKKGCDDTHNGAYSLGYTFLRSIAQSCINCTEDDKSEAKLKAVFSGILRIVEPSSADAIYHLANLTAEGDLVKMEHFFSKLSDITETDESEKEQNQTNGLVTATIKWIHKRGYGFIIMNNGEELFFPVSSHKNRLHLYSGQKVKVRINTKDSSVLSLFKDTI